MQYYSPHSHLCKQRHDMKDIVEIDTPELVGVRFRFKYSGEFGPESKCIVASWDGDEEHEPHRCRFQKRPDGSVDRSIVIIPLDASRLPQRGRIYVERQFFVPDSDFNDGYNNVKIGEWLEEPTDEDSTIYSTLVKNAMRGESVDPNILSQTQSKISQIESELTHQQSVNAQQQQQIDANAEANAQQQQQINANAAAIILNNSIDDSQQQQIDANAEVNVQQQQQIDINTETNAQQQQQIDANTQAADLATLDDIDTMFA